MAESAAGRDVRGLGGYADRRLVTVLCLSLAPSLFLFCLFRSLPLCICTLIHRSVKLCSVLSLVASMISSAPGRISRHCFFVGGRPK